MSRILKELGWTPQKPIRPAKQRKEAEIQRWKAERWPELKKRQPKKDKRSSSSTKSGFYLLPMVVRTYAPCGCTPILKEYLSYSSLSVIGAVTPPGRLFLKTYMHSITSREVVAFLGQLQRLIPGLLLVIWDGSPTHRSQFLRDYLASGATQRLHLERLPGYAPELNPTEWVWSYLKLADLANIACDHLPELDAHLYEG